MPSNLALCRSLNPGLFLMFAGTMDGSKPELPIEVTVHNGLGTLSSHTLDPHQKLADNGAGNPANPNPVRVESARLPAFRDTLVVRGTIHVTNGAWGPESCTSPEYLKVQAEFLENFANRGGFDALAERYLMNVINGRWLARNRICRKVAITVSADGTSETFDANDIRGGYSLKISDLPLDKQDAAHAIAKKWAKALCAKTPLETVYIDVVAKLERGANAEVFPSQPFIEKEAGDKKNRRPSRLLASVTLEDGSRQAVMHAEKVGNGLRTIDSWYGENVTPIAVEPYGSVPRLQQALRLTTDGAVNFYDLQIDLQGLVANMTERWNDALFFGAMLVRGGMFGHTKKDGKKGGEAAE